MYFNRYEAKMRAKQCIRVSYPHPALVTLIYVLLTTVLTNVVMYFVSNPFEMAYLYLLDGVYDPARIFQMFFTPQRVGLYVILNLLVNLYVSVMRFGYVSYTLRVSRREQPSYHNLMDGFAMLGRVLGITILQAIFIYLWTMLGMIPYFVVLLASVFMESTGLMVLAVVLAIAGGIFGVAMSYRYALSDYFLLDHPGEMGVLACIRESKRAMAGRKWSLFVLDLSFLGWDILSMLTLGILGLWVTPYASVTRAHFYDWAVHGAFPEGPEPHPNPGPSGGNPNPPQF